MRRGEKAVLALIGLVVVGGMVQSAFHAEEQHDRDIPFYSTATPDVARQAMDIIRDNGCKSCHSLWTLKDVLQSVPAPMLDGIGAIRDETWLYQYLSASDPQAILPSRLKKEYRMPSYAGLTDEQRRILAKYLASLQVKDWYLDQTKKAEYEKLTGKEPQK
ncbi:cytochrome c [mine drainage metagenome]|uniref:Cytochrome c n=1 Tax=mine drainage metagenome TaxID=410659 RepID=A0A1J5TSY2_9ZZZZ